MQCIITKRIIHIITEKSSFRIQMFHDIYQSQKKIKKKKNLTFHTSKKTPSQFHQLLFTSCALVKIM